MSLFNHPILFAVVTVAAIGVAIYEYISTQNERRNVYRGNPLRPPRDDPPRPPRGDPPRPPRGDPPRPSKGDPPRDDPPKPPRTSIDDRPGSFSSPKKSSTHSKPPSTSDNTLRKRYIDQAPLKKNSDELKKSTETVSGRDNQNIHNEMFDKNMPSKLSNDLSLPSPSINDSGKNNLDQSSQKTSSDNLKRSDNVRSINAAKKSTETSSMKESQNTEDKKFNENNYSKNMLDKLSNDTKNVNKNLKSEKNIFEEESVSPENNLSSKDEEKSSNQTSDMCDKRVKRLKKHESAKKSFENHNYDKRNISSHDNSYGYEAESEKSSDEDSYKNEVYNALMNDIHNMNEASKNRNCDRTEGNLNTLTIVSDKSTKENLAESNICEACEENLINTRAYPCGHSYLCVDCAVRIFRIYKKCKVCLQHVEEFVQHSS